MYAEFPHDRKYNRALIDRLANEIEDAVWHLVGGLLHDVVHRGRRPLVLAKLNDAQRNAAPDGARSEQHTADDWAAIRVARQQLLQIE